MILKIHISGQNKITFAKENDVTVEIDDHESSIILSTHYRYNSPGIDKVVVFATINGRLVAM